MRELKIRIKDEILEILGGQTRSKSGRHIEDQLFVTSRREEHTDSNARKSQGNLRCCFCANSVRQGNVFSMR